MTQDEQRPGIPLEQALRAQKAMRDAAGLPPESFPVEAFVGMVSDEIDALRSRGRSDEEIARLIAESSSIRIAPADIAEHYAPAEQRHLPDE